MFMEEVNAPEEIHKMLRSKQSQSLCTNNIGWQLNLFELIHIYTWTGWNSWEEAKRQTTEPMFVSVVRRKVAKNFSFGRRICFA